MYVAMLHLRLLENFSTGDPGTFWLVSPSLHGLETSNFLFFFFFFPAAVLVMVALIKKQFFKAIIMVGFVMGGHCQLPEGCGLS